MTIIQDSREKRHYHDNVVDGLTALGHKVVRSKLYVGDYTLPANQSVCIDLKQDLQEVYSNIIAQHDRFIRECKRAQDAGIRLIILTEQGGIRSVQDVAKWRNPRIARWFKIRDGQIRGAYRGIKLPKQPPVSSDRLAKAMQTIAERYCVEWMFCAKSETVKVICELLEIEVK